MTKAAWGRSKSCGCRLMHGLGKVCRERRAAGAARRGGVDDTNKAGGRGSATLGAALLSSPPAMSTATRSSRCSDYSSRR